MHKITPRLWSDFDGTAVEIAGKTNPRNWLKYPLPGVAGYADFLRGVQSTGVEVAGIVSRRPDILVRKLVTARSVTKLGLNEFFTRPDQIVHKGSEEAKGRFVAERSRRTTVGMIEDKPHKLGAVLLGALSEPLQHPEARHYPVVLGVVAHGKSQEYIERLADQAILRAGCDIQLTEVTEGTEPAVATGFRVEADAFSLEVVPLEPYSEAAGAAFGQRLLAAA